MVKRKEKYRHSTDKCKDILILKIEVIKEKDNELTLRIDGEGHTIGNLLQYELQKDKKVETAGYDVPHPLVDSLILHIRVKGKKPPREVLYKTLKKIKIDTQQLQKEINKSIEQV